MKETKLPSPLQKLAEAIEAKGLKVQFGLVQQGHIPTIEKILSKESALSEHTWQKIGKEIGWDYKTAAFYYIDYLRNILKTHIAEQLHHVKFKNHAPEPENQKFTFRKKEDFIINSKDLHNAGYITNELLPCPFCGCTKILTAGDRNPNSKNIGYSAWCSDIFKCGAYISVCIGGEETAEEARKLAVESWNKRIKENNLISKLTN